MEWFGATRQSIRLVFVNVRRYNNKTSINRHSYLIIKKSSSAKWSFRTNQSIWLNHHPIFTNNSNRLLFICGLRLKLEEKETFLLKEINSKPESNDCRSNQRYFISFFQLDQTGSWFTSAQNAFVINFRFENFHKNKKYSMQFSK